MVYTYRTHDGKKIEVASKLTNSKDHVDKPKKSDAEKSKSLATKVIDKIKALLGMSKANGEQ
jgi:hypothetical protein